MNIRLQILRCRNNMDTNRFEIWPPKSSDLNPLDFYLRRHLKMSKHQFHTMKRMYIGCYENVYRMLAKFVEILVVYEWMCQSCACTSCSDMYGKWWTLWASLV